MRTLLEKQQAQYRSADPIKRGKMLENLKTLIKKLPSSITNTKQLASTYRIMAETALLLKYIESLNETEQKFAKDTTTPLATSSELKNAFRKIMPTSNGQYCIIDNTNVDNDPTHLLDSYLQSVGNNLYVNAEEQYNLIDTDTFKKTITECLIDPNAEQILPGYDTLSIAIGSACVGHSGSNAELLKILVETTIATYQITDDPKNEKSRFIENLRKKLQISTFKHSEIYQQALDFIKATNKKLSLRQLTIEEDKHKRYSIDASLILEPLDTWFQGQGINNEEKAVSSATNDDGQRNFIAMLIAYESTSPIEISLVLASHLEWIKQNTWAPNLISNQTNTEEPTPFSQAKDALIGGIDKMITAEGELSSKHQFIFQETITSLTAINSSQETNAALKAPLKTLIEKVQELKDTNKLPLELLNKVLLQTKTALDTHKWDTYSDFAKSLQHGKPTREKLALSCMMLTLCAVAVGLACAGYIPILAGTLAASVFAIGSAYSFFNNRKDGLHKATNQLVKASEHIATNPTP